ncbi:unnamed protein product [Miscanthus lutarioriparius]|uniref:Uncharacterized protein n=1 Tax=Miscanthus lutarioriparius TaxID=422564 RepID=A0A811R7S1_9POAL|nr:unnamed protein product [Miscanthus lutarioriparius]
MLLAYVLIFLLHLSASTCYATSRNQHLLFAGRADDATALLPAKIHHHHHRHTAKAEVLPDYNDVRHYHPKMMARWGGGAPPRPPSTSPSVELAGIGGAPPPPSLSAVEMEPKGVEGAPSPPGKRDTSAALEPSPSPMPSPPHGEGASSSDASATGQEESAASDDVDVNADYDGPMTHPPSHN